LQLQRDLFKLQGKKQATMKEIKRQANLGQIRSAYKRIAKDLVRQRKSQERVRMMIGNSDAIALQITSMASPATIAQSMKATVKSMAKLNGMLNNKELGVGIFPYRCCTVAMCAQKFPV
jgi:hypothetical protein